MPASRSAPPSGRRRGGIGGVAQALAGEALDLRERALDLRPHALGESAGGEVRVAGRAWSR